jgi:hypothetical protein
MEIRFNRTGAERKALVAAVSEIIGCESDYMGAPGFAYAIGQHIIDRDGTLILGEHTDSMESKAILTALTAQGFEFETPTDLGVDEDTSYGLSIEFPLEGFNDTALQNLEKLVVSKATLIQKAVGAESLPITKEDDRLCFPWFTLSTAEATDAYTRFIHALCEMAKTQKRVTAQERPVESEKYAFRCFLLRLGFKGAEFASARKILLANLSGNGSFSNNAKNKMI